MIQIQTNVLGVFAIKNGKIIEKILFEEDKDREIAKKLILSRNNAIEDEISLIKKIKAKEILIRNKHRFEKKEIKEELKGINIQELKISDIISINKIAEQIGKDFKEINEKLYKINLEITKEEMRSLEREFLAIVYIKKIDELDKTINLMNEFLHESYGYHFPELEDIVKNEIIFARIASMGNKSNIRNNIQYNNIKDLNFSEQLLKKLNDAIENSFGANFSDNDLKNIQIYAQEILNLYNLRKNIDENLKILMNEIMPNVTYLVGHLIAARLLTYVGSLKKLAFLPSSTIQMLGAEKAMFKFLITKKRPPKHGIIFNVPEIYNAKKKNRGKIARHLAAKISIASKADYFKGEFIGENLKRDFLNFVSKMK